MARYRRGKAYDGLGSFMRSIDRAPRRIGKGVKGVTAGGGRGGRKLGRRVRSIGLGAARFGQFGAPIGHSRRRKR